MAKAGKLIGNGPMHQSMRRNPDSGKYYYTKKKPIPVNDKQPLLVNEPDKSDDNNVSKVQSENLSPIQQRIVEARDRLQQSTTQKYDPFAEEGFEVQRGMVSKTIHQLVQKFRASYSEDDEAALSTYLQEYNCRLGLYSETEKNVRSEIADIAFSGTVERPFKGYSLNYARIANNPQKYSINPCKNEDYDGYIEKSLWAVMKQLPEFAAIEKRVVSEMAKAGVPPQIVPEMNLTDFKHLLAVHCNVGGGYAFSKIFPKTDDNGEIVRDNRGKIVTTSAKQEATIEFIAQNEKSFRALMMQQDHAKKDYVDALVEEMKKGNTDMSRFLSQHPEWKDQTAINLHHIIAKKDVRLLEKMGLEFKDINLAKNLCVMDCGSVSMMLKTKESKSNEQNTPQEQGKFNKLYKRVTRLLAGTHGEMHNHDTTFHNGQMVRRKFGEPVPEAKDKVIMRIEPGAGVVCMIGTGQNSVIIDDGRKAFDLAHRCRADLRPDMIRPVVHQPLNQTLGVTIE